MSRRRTLAGAVCVLGTGALVAGLLVWPGGGSGGDHGGRGVAAAASSSAAAGGAAAVGPTFVDPLAVRLGIPPRYLTLYRQAGARYGLDWTRLAAVGAVESVHGQALAAGVTSGANHRGASGPAQFLASTWDRFGLDGDGDGVRDPHDPDDAIVAMASYLRASGAPEDWHGALRTYNHSDMYASAVERLAASYRRVAG
jgi:membrane-bound lytic murein transglycosylase B